MRRTGSTAWMASTVAAPKISHLLGVHPSACASCTTVGFRFRG